MRETVEGVIMVVTWVYSTGFKNGLDPTATLIK